MTTHFYLVTRLRMVDLYLHSPVHIQGIVLNWLSTQSIKYVNKTYIFFTFSTFIFTSSQFCIHYLKHCWFYFCLCTLYMKVLCNWDPIHFQNEYIGIHQHCVRHMVSTAELCTPAGKPMWPSSQVNSLIAPHEDLNHTNLPDLTYHCDSPCEMA
jgi:hypothetical protein